MTRVSPALVAAVSGASQQMWDLRRAPFAAVMTEYYDAQFAFALAGGGGAMSATPIPTGTAPPAVVFSGAGLNRWQALWVSVEPGAATFQWSNDNGDNVTTPAAGTNNPPGGWQGGTGIAIPVGGGTVALNSDTNVVFPAGVYSVDNVWEAAVDTWASKGVTANCDLGSALHVPGTTQRAKIEWRRANNRKPSMLTNFTVLNNDVGCPALVNGLALSWEIWELAGLQVWPVAVAALVPWAYTNNLVASNAKNILDTFVAGSTAVAGHPNEYGTQRRDDVPNATKQAFSGANKLDIPNQHVHRWSFDGASGILSYYQDGFLIAQANILTAGTLNVNRMTLGCVKAGTTAAANFVSRRWSARFAVNRVLTANEALWALKALS